MKKLKVSDILKEPDHQIKIVKLDFNDPWVKEVLAKAKKDQEHILALKDISQEDLKKEINI